jgi:hypothetical protein
MDDGRAGPSDTFDQSNPGVGKYLSQKPQNNDI